MSLSGYPASDETVRTRGADGPAAIRLDAEPLPDIDAVNFGEHFDRFGDARIVLIGDASHGTSEFYRARAAITRRLIEKHGFNIVALEADWPDAAAFDRFVRYRGPAHAGAEPPFQRFPRWMWRNHEVDAFMQWLRDHNRFRTSSHRAAVHGLDLYSLGASMAAVVAYLDRTDTEAAAYARERYACLGAWAGSPQSYGHLSVARGFAACEAPVIEILRALLAKRLDYVAKDPEGYLDAAMNARLVRDAEAYYRAMYLGAAESWNLRDRHMFETLEYALVARGPAAKAVVWAHNSHVGDARQTGMGRERGEFNLGQLCRERFGDEAALIGMGTYDGEAACASDWDGPMEVKAVNAGMPGSYEAVSHEAGIVADWLLDLRDGEAREALTPERLERFIGVIYRPETERWSHYVEAELPRQFDAWLWFDRTHAVTPLPEDHAPEAAGAQDETWPSGL